MSKKILAVILALIIAVFTFASCNKDVDDSYYVDDEGQTQKAEKDENGNYFITDDEGNTTYIDKENLINSSDKEEESKIQELVDEVQKNPDKVFDNADKNDSLQISDDLVKEEIVVVEPDKGEAKAQVRLDNYKKVLSTNKFTLEATVKEVGTESMEYPFVYIRSGNNAFIETAVPFEEGKVVKANMIIKDGVTYCEMPSMKCYMIVDDMSIEDLASGTFDESGITSHKFVESGTVKLNGKTYTCDVFEVDGETAKYYYDSKETLVRIEKIGKRESVITEIKSLKNSVDESKIRKPKGIDITSLVE